MAAIANPQFTDMDISIMMVVPTACTNGTTTRHRQETCSHCQRRAHGIDLEFKSCAASSAVARSFLPPKESTASQAWDFD